MKKNWLVLLGLVVIIGMVACNKDTAFNPVGGELPTHYINYKDTVFTPSSLIEANGSNFTFLNSSDDPITIVGDDTSILKSVTIGPRLSYFFKPDTVPVVPAQIFIFYHCVEHPTARGLITLNP